MNSGSWRPALRIAARDSWRHRLRSLVVVALIGLPIFALTAGDVLYRTWQLPDTEQAQRVLGSSSAWISWYGERDIEQSDRAPWDGSVGWSGGESNRPVPSDRAVAASLPAGSRVIGYRTAIDPLSFYTPAGLDTATWVGLDYTDPIARGIVQSRRGRSPTRPGEAAITATLAAATGLGIGDTLHATSPARSFRVTAIVRTVQSPRDETVYTLPGAVPAASSDGGEGGSGWLARVPHGVSWPEVQRLDHLGFVTLSRQVYLHPSPAARAAMSGGSSDTGQLIAAGALVAGMALLEVVLLAGPAFAVGARRRSRDLALVAAVGATARDLRRCVLADAVVLGLASGVLGVGAGIGIAAAVEPLLIPHLTHLPGTFNVPVVDIVVLVALASVTALLAAVAPAIRAARLDVVATLAGRRGTTRTRRRWPLLGVLVAALGCAVCLGAARAGQRTTDVLAGVVLIEAGVIVATPALLGLVSRAARWLPVSSRMALRDAGRTRAASTPAVAAVMAAVIGATTALIVAASTYAHNEATYLPSLPRRDTFVSVVSHPGDATAIAAALRRIVPSADVSVVRMPAGTCDTFRVPVTGATCTPVTADYGADANRAFYTSGVLPDVIVAEPAQVAALYGRAEPRAVAALAAGRALLPGALVHDGRARITLGDTSRSRTVIITATAVATTYLQPAAVVVPPSALAKLGRTSIAAGVLVDSGSSLSAAQQQALNLVLARTGHAHPVQYETGYHDSTDRILYAIVGVAAFVAIFAALLATALANIDGRADLVALGAIGAAPRTRRVLAMSRALVIAGIGCVIGTLVGVVPATAWLRSQQIPFTMPWTLAALLVVGVPALTAVLAGASTRARLPSE